MVFHDLDSIRTEAVAKENEIGARPPRVRDDQPITIEKMRHFRDFLRPWVFLRPLDIGKLAVAGRVETERREIRQCREMQRHSRLDLQLVKAVADLRRKDRLPP
jgi:hypothetical protein